MLEYPGENHGLAKPANQQDYTVRMKEFFDHYLMGKPAPEWVTDGVPRLEMEEHLKERANSRKSAAEREKAARRRPGRRSSIDRMSAGRLTMSWRSWSRAWPACPASRRSCGWRRSPGAAGSRVSRPTGEDGGGPVLLFR